MAKRTGYDIWGPGRPRRIFGEKHWNEPLHWAKSLPARYGRRPRVFSGSMCDVFDKDAPAGAREDLFELIESTPQLDWLLLTKRVGNAQRMVPEAWLKDFPANVWLGATIVTQEEADRDLHKLLSLPARITFLSVEPMIESLTLRPVELRLLSWVICGGESGARARPMDERWALWLRTQCDTLGIPFFMKQLSQATHPKTFRSFEHFPEKLRVREFPASAVVYKRSTTN